MQTTYDYFEKVDICVGKIIIKVADFAKARKPAYKLWINFGELGVSVLASQPNCLPMATYTLCPDKL